MKKLAVASALCIGLVSTAIQAAPANPTINDKFAVRVGPFFSSMDTKVKVGNEEQVFEDYLDDSKTTVAIQGLWRITNNVRLRAGYWSVDREESDALSQSTTIGGIAIPAGTSVSAIFDTSLLSAALGWSFVSTDTTEFGVELGIASLRLNSELTTNVPGLGSASLTAIDKSYPLPSLGLYVTQALSPKWSLAARIGGLGLDIGDEFKGTVLDGMAAVEFRPWENLGIGLSYLYSHADAEIKNVRDGVVDVDWTYQGPFAYLTLGFGRVQ